MYSFPIEPHGLQSDPFWVVVSANLRLLIPVPTVVVISAASRRLSISRQIIVTESLPRVSEAWCGGGNARSMYDTVNTE
jgi:hypothetical protein